MEGNMNHMLESALQYLQSQGIALGLKLLAALAIWIICRWLIRFVVRLVNHGLERREVDPTLLRYSATILRITLTTLLVVALLGFFGVDTASFAALLAGVGLAIGMAWSGLLKDFAAGAFMIVLRPFGVGDEVVLNGDVHGIVKDVGLFMTTIDQWVTHHDVIISNGTVFSKKIQNLSRNPQRGAEILVQLSTTADYEDMCERFREGLKEIPGMVDSPSPHVSVCQHTMAGPMIHVRPVASREDFWSVYWTTHHMIRHKLDEAGYMNPGNGIEIISQAPPAA